MNDNHKEKDMDMEVQKIDTTKERVHYGGQKKESIIGTDGVEK